MAVKKDFKSKFKARQEQEKSRIEAIQTQPKSKFANFTSVPAEAEIKEELTASPQTETAGPASKKIKMAFSQSNYRFIKETSEELGQTMYALVNYLITMTSATKVDKYISEMLMPPTKNNIPRKKGAALPRISLTFTPEAHSILTREADRYNQTITQYANIVIEIARKQYHVT